MEALMPTQWSELKDIDDVEPLNDGDMECLSAIRDVLRKFGKLDRLGVALLHSHFDLANDEVMVETSDEASRTLTTRPLNHNEATGNMIGTTWMLREGDMQTMAWCQQYCSQLSLGHHGTAHANRKD